jgi:hypothetical protein
MQTTQTDERTRDTMSRRAHRVHRGLVELVPDAEETPGAAAAEASQLRENLTDAACRVLFAGACLAQIADAITTVIGLSRTGRFEANFLMRTAVTVPALSGFIKLTLVVLVCSVALVRLSAPRARVALLLAMALGFIAPIQNVFQILGPR